MKSLTLKFIAALMLTSAAGLVVAIFAASGEPISLAQMASTPTPGSPPKMDGPDDWILLDNVPPGSPQIEYGREIYRLVCSACHGDQGQGLTTEWRMTWAPADRNCWQSKCHALNHPSDGFFLPYSPPIENLARNGRFPTALELEIYVRQYMPWHDPGSLRDERAWQVASYVLKLNGIDAGPELNVETAAKIRLAPERTAAVPEAAAVSSGEESAQAAVESPASRTTPLLIAAACTVILVLVGGVFLRRKVRR